MTNIGTRNYLLLEEISPYISIDYLFNDGCRNLSYRAYNALTANGIRTIEKLLKCTREDLLSMTNIGKAIVEDIDCRLRIRLGVGLGEWRPS